MDIYEIVGWLGALLVVTAYAIVTKRGTSVWYHLMNLAGAAGLFVNALHHGALPSTGLNVVWGAIAIWGITTMARTRST